MCVVRTLSHFNTFEFFNFPFVYRNTLGKKNRIENYRTKPTMKLIGHSASVVMTLIRHIMSGCEVLIWKVLLFTELNFVYALFLVTPVFSLVFFYIHFYICFKIRLCLSLIYTIRLYIVGVVVAPVSCWK